MDKEDDPVLPINKYAWSKLGGECAVRMYDNSLIIRTSFGDTVFPYERAFVDQWTSRLRVDVLAMKLVELLKSNLTGTIHVGGKRQTVMDYARSVSPDKTIGNLSLKDVTFAAPKDTSLDTSRYDSEFGE
jgi:dTDP-4-dehydrorhamnose reductase